ncbi:helix-turn-helix transcriptional regulator [Kitasatospora sp. NPDC002551]|uniref:AraC family transcriptional regulator n=1 Tax=unclassified Kitasatospora TaxID=2633591 RepID=UPI00332CB3E3
MIESLSFDSASAEATEEFLSTAYTPMRIGKSVVDARARINRRAVGGLSVDRLSFGYDMAFNAESLRRVCLISMHSGTLAVRDAGGEETVFGPGETFLIAPPDAPYRGEVRAARYTIAMFDSGLLDAVAPTGADGSGPVRLTGARAADQAANRQLGAAVAYVRDHVLDNPVACESALLVATAAQHLAAATLAALPHTARTDPAADRTDAMPATVRRAVAFIEANAERDIALADIAAAAFVTPRGLQYAFRRHLGTTPLAHLRRVRLDAAHRELLAADPAGTTVTRIAMRWGFAHAGHFAGLYRRTYLRRPGDTLRERG